jgi:ethanolamine ammonia-lyase large subunit
VKLKTTLFGQTFTFRDVKDVMNKAGELRSGDVLAGVAAASATERVAAKHVLSEITLGEVRENPAVPYEADAVTRVIQDAVNEPPLRLAEILDRGEFREFLRRATTTNEDIRARAEKPRPPRWPRPSPRSCPTPTSCSRPSACPWW